MSSSSKLKIPGDEALKECLEEAGVYEENMSLRDMLRYYKAIQSSKSTAQHEEKQNCLIETTDKSCELLEELKENTNLTISKLPLSVQSKENDDQEEDKIITTNAPVKATATAIKTVKATATAIKEKRAVAKEEEEGKEVSYDFFNCPPLKHKPLDITFHEPKYNLPVHCDPDVLNLPLQTRTEFIYNFHRSLLDKFYKLHCESLNPAPWGKPVQENHRFNNGSLDRKTFAKSEEREVEEPSTSGGPPEAPASSEIYTSRSGRQTKRKVYVENVDEKSKKLKKDEDEDFQLHAKHPIKRPTPSKLSSTELMKKSKLFADGPKASRNELLFGQIIEDEKKKKQTQKATENFKNVFRESGDEGGDGKEERQLQEVSVESEVKSQPVTPRQKSSATPRGRKSARKLNMTSERGRSRTPKTNNQSRSQETPPDNSPESQSPLLDEAAAWGEGEAKCPICSEVFSQDIIEEHASSCGLGMDTESNFENVPRDNQKTIKCGICNKEMLFDLSYEVHVKDCIARTVSSKS